MSNVPSSDCASSDFIVKDCHVHGMGIHLRRGDYYRCRSCRLLHKNGDTWTDAITHTQYMYDGTFWQPQL